MKPMDKEELTKFVFCNTPTENGMERLKITKPEIFKDAIIQYLSFRSVARLMLSPEWKAFISEIKGDENNGSTGAETTIVY